MLYREKENHSESSAALGHGQRSSGVLVLGDLQHLAGQGPKQPHLMLKWFVFGAGGLGKMLPLPGRMTASLLLEERSYLSAALKICNTHTLKRTKMEKRLWLEHGNQSSQRYLNFWIYHHPLHSGNEMSNISKFSVKYKHCIYLITKIFR